MGIQKQTEEPTSAAFNVTKQEKIAKKEIHIVGQRVKHYREKRGMEQMALAKILGVKSNAISNWKHGRTRRDLNKITKYARLSESDSMNCSALTIRCVPLHQKNVLLLRITDI